MNTNVPRISVRLTDRPTCFVNEMPKNDPLITSKYSDKIYEHVMLKMLKLKSLVAYHSSARRIFIFGGYNLNLLCYQFHRMKIAVVYSCVFDMECVVTRSLLPRLLMKIHWIVFAFEMRSKTEPISICTRPAKMPWYNILYAFVFALHCQLAFSSW